MKSAGFQVKSTGFHTPDFMCEIRRISKDQLPGMVSPMFIHVEHPEHQIFLRVYYNINPGLNKEDDG